LDTSGIVFGVEVCDSSLTAVVPIIRVDDNKIRRFWILGRLRFFSISRGWCGEKVVVFPTTIDREVRGLVSDFGIAVAVAPLLLLMMLMVLLLLLSLLVVRIR
jgi:hypothetical protein